MCAAFLNAVGKFVEYSFPSSVIATTSYIQFINVIVPISGSCHPIYEYS